MGLLYILIHMLRVRYTYQPKVSVTKENVTYPKSHVPCCEGHRHIARN